MGGEASGMSGKWKPSVPMRYEARRNSSAESAQRMTNTPYSR